MIAFGGLTSTGTVTETDVLDIATNTWTRVTFSPPTATPPSRGLHNAIYDPVRDRMIVIGGWSGKKYLNDVWVLSLTSPMQWTNLTTAGGAFPARGGAAAAYDASSDRILVFGGYNDPASGSSVIGDVWSLSLSGTPTWSDVTPAGPSPGPRSEMAYALDTDDQQLVIFGGYDGAFHNDSWALSLAGSPSWTQINAAGTLPATMKGSAAVYDATLHRLFLHGGADGSDPLHAQILHNEVWVLSIGSSPAWTLFDHGPTAIWRHAMAVPPGIRKAYVFEGAIAAGFNAAAYALPLGSVAAAPASAWSPRRRAPTAVPAPAPARGAYAFAYDARRGSIILFGGYDGADFKDDTWEFADDSTGWTQIVSNDTRPPARDACRAIYDPVRDQVVLFGGRTFPNAVPTYPNDTWVLQRSGNSGWTLLPVTGAPPGRAEYAMIYDAASDRILIYGGRNETTVYDDVWALTLSDDHWTQVQPAGQGPGKRFGHSMTCVPELDRAVIFAGQLSTSASDVYGDTWTLSLGSSPAWQQVFPLNVPSARTDHAAAYDAINREVFMFGGAGGNGFLGDAWALSTPGAMDWLSAVYSDGVGPSYRDNHDVLYDSARHRFILQGGYNTGYGWLNDTWAFSWDLPVPVQISLVNASVTNGVVTLDWYSEDRHAAGRVYRAGDDRVWTGLGTVSADGSGHLRYEDHSVRPGRRYFYRLGVMEQGAESFVGEIAVEVPGVMAFGIGVVRFAGRGVSVRCTLPAAGDVEAVLLDIGGRRIAESHASATAPGAMEIRLDAPHLAPGLYLVRLGEAGRTISRKAILFR